MVKFGAGENNYCGACGRSNSDGCECATSVIPTSATSDLQTNASAAIDALVAERVAPICCACGGVQRIGGVITETGIGGVGVEPVSVADLPEGWVVGAFAQSTGRLGVGDVESGVSVGEVGGAAPFALCPACFRAGSRAVEQALEPLAARRGRS